MRAALRANLARAELAANGVALCQPRRVPRFTVVMHGKKKQRSLGDREQPPPILETFGENISAPTASSNELAGLLKKKKMENMMTRNREIANERILAWRTEGRYELLGHMYS